MIKSAATQKEDHIAITVIIPAYNEARTIGATLETLAQHIGARNYGNVEVIISIGDGEDDTAGIARSKSHLFSHFEVMENGNPPHKGRNVKLAMLRARGDKCVFMDADLATPLHHLDNLLAMLDRHDVASGERDVIGIHTGHRKFISVFGNFLVRSVLLLDMKDTQCGFKGFRRDAARELFAKQRITSWGFDMEILALARAMHLSSGQLPIPDWTEVKGGGGLDRGPIKALSASVSTFYDLLRIRFYLLTRAYGKIEKARSIEA